ncbi:MAG: hypothetical protein AAB664_03610, partial [Patescibacteria group bacterium]
MQNSSFVIARSTTTKQSLHFGQKDCFVVDDLPAGRQAPPRNDTFESFLTVSWYNEMHKLEGMFSFRNVSISKQLSVFFVFVFLIPMLVIGVFFYLSVQNTIAQNKTELDYLATLHVNRVQAILNEVGKNSLTIDENEKAMQQLFLLQTNFESLSKTGQMQFFVKDASEQIRMISPTRFDVRPDRSASIFAIRDILS